MDEFTREERYIVIKRKHMDQHKENYLRGLLKTLDIQLIEAVVVEKDWPEYEPVWNMIEKRVTDDK